MSAVYNPAKASALIASMFGGKSKTEAPKPAAKREPRKQPASQEKKKTPARKPTTKDKPEAPAIKSRTALIKSMESNPSKGGATYASRRDRGPKPRVAEYLIGLLRKASKSKPVSYGKLYDALVAKFGPGTEYDRRAEGLDVTLRDYLYRNLKNRHGVELGGDMKAGLWIKREPKASK